MSENMSTNQMKARIAELEEAATKRAVTGAIHASPSKACREGDVKASIICFRNFNANGKFPLTMHGSQFVRFAEQIQVLTNEVDEQKDKWLYRSDEERKDVAARLKVLRSNK
jgi:hypothetical protein